MEKSARFFVSSLFAFVLVGGGLFVFDWASERAAENKFLDECQFSAAETKPDGSVTARQRINPYPLCHLELLKAKTITTVVTFPIAPQTQPKAADAPAKESK